MTRDNRDVRALLREILAEQKRTNELLAERQVARSSVYGSLLPVSEEDERVVADWLRDKASGVVPRSGTLKPEPWKCKHCGTTDYTQVCPEEDPEPADLPPMVEGGAASG